MASDRLFVYGSLKRGARHHHELRGARFLGEARTTPGYALETVGEYLALVHAPGTLGSVEGELFEVDEGLLRQLDEFEGDQYDRDRVRLGSVMTPAAAADPLDPAPASFALAYVKKTR